MYNDIQLNMWNVFQLFVQNMYNDIQLNMWNDIPLCGTEHV